MNSSVSFIRDVEATISRYNMIRCGDRVVVGVSGGPDSVCLLDVLYGLREKLSLELVVAHYEHGLRPGEDEKETSFVRQLAEHYNLPFVSEKARELRPGLPNPEETARILRYKFLEQTRISFSAHKIALGHNRDDQAETVLMRLIRGSGLSGLTGIPPVRDQVIIRPLIERGRDQILSYMRYRGLQWMIDSSNLKTDYLRNRVRHEILPVLRKYQPRINEILSHTAEVLREEDHWLDQEADIWLDRLAAEKRERYISVNISRLTEVPKALAPRVIRQMIRTVKGNLRKITANHIKSICHLAKSAKAQAQVHLPDDILAIKTYDILEITNIHSGAQQDFTYQIERPGRFSINALGKTVSVEEFQVLSALPRLDESPWTGFFDAGEIEFPLTLRNFKPGDSFVPLGMKGRKKLKDFFIDLKIPSVSRKTIPILISKNEIIWVCGLRIDDRFKVDSGTGRILRVSFEEKVV